jgi:hypothetical protein
MIITDKFVFMCFPRTGTYFCRNVLNKHFDCENIGVHEVVIPEEHKDKPVFAVKRDVLDWWSSWYWLTKEYQPGFMSILWEKMFADKDPILLDFNRLNDDLSLLIGTRIDEKPIHVSGGKSIPEDMVEEWITKYWLECRHIQDMDFVGLNS